MDFVDWIVYVKCLICLVITLSVFVKGCWWVGGWVYFICLLVDLLLGCFWVVVLVVCYLCLVGLGFMFV